MINRRTIAILSALLPIAGVLTACASTPTAREVAALGAYALVGTWTSELDNTTLTVAKDGTFRLDRAATTVKPSLAIAGQWSLDGNSVVFRNAAGSGACEGVDGAYTPEVVRDTVRFTKRQDDCPAREEHFAWPWTRKPR